MQTLARLYLYLQWTELKKNWSVKACDVHLSVLIRPLLKGTVPFGLLMCPLWSVLKTKLNVPYANPLTFDYFKFKYLTWQGFTGLLLHWPVMNLTMPFKTNFWQEHCSIVHIQCWRYFVHTLYQNYSKVVSNCVYIWTGHSEDDASTQHCPFVFLMICPIIEKVNSLMVSCSFSYLGHNV